MSGIRKSSGYSCARCVKHKKKCEPTLGPCANCTRAKTECSKASHGAGHKPYGRRYVEPLLETIKHLKHELAHGENPVGDAISALSTSQLDLPCTDIGAAGKNAVAQEGQRYVFGADAASCARRSMSSRIVRYTNHSAYLDRLWSGAELPFPLISKPGATRYRRPAFRETFVISSHVHGEATRKLLQTYVDHILPQCPLFSPGEVYQIYDATYGRTSDADRAAKSDSFIISMIMAIATIFSKDDDYRRALDLSEAFRKEAMDAESQGQLFATTSIRCLQALLLLVQYGVFVPHAVSIWHTASEAMRVSVELGLHREPPEVSQLDEQTMRARRRLFWATYSLERSVTLALHRPLAIRDDHIRLNVVPSDHSNNSQLTYGNAPATARYLTHLQYCSLQTEICLVNISCEPIRPPVLTYSEWVSSCERRIESLRGDNWKDAILIPDWLDLPSWRCLAYLYMPCPRNPCPSAETTTKFIRALMQMLDIYWTLAQSKSLKLCWFAVHHAYEIGTQLLYCMQNYPQIVQTCYDSITLLDTLTHLSDFLASMEERWPASLQCKTLINQLKKDIVVSFMQGKSPDTLDAEHSGERRILDFIFRKNGFLFLATEPLGIQSDVEALFLNANLNLPSQIQSSIDQFPDCFDLNADCLMDLDHFDEFFLNSFVDEPVGGATFPAVSIPSAYYLSATEKEPFRRSEKTQSLIDSCNQILGNMPACKLCRSRRIKCSRTLPACHNCVDYGEQCTYLESSTGQWLTGKYLHELQKEIRSSLTALDEHYRGQSNSLSPSSQLQNRPQSKSSEALAAILIVYETLSGTSTFYFGETSVFGRLAAAKSLPAADALGRGRIPTLHAEPSSPIQSTLLRSLDELPRETLVAQVQLYCQKVETFYSILGTALPFDIVECVYGRASVNGLSHQSCQACLNLILAIGLITPFNGRSASFASAAVYFDRALSIASSGEGLFLSSTIASLRFTLLTCFYVWLHPSSGNFFRLVSAACRICLDLFESRDLSTEETAILRTLFRTTYVLDTFTAIAFGRPNYLPEGKSLEKMVVASVSDQRDGKLALQVFNIAGLQSTIHQSILSSVNFEQDECIFPISKIISLKGRADEWLDAWRHETSALTEDKANMGVSESEGVDAIDQYGVILHTKAISLLQTLAERLGLLVESGLSLSVAELLVDAYSTLHSASLATSADVPGDFGFPITISHYFDLFHAGLDLVNPGVLTMALPAQRAVLLERCHVLLRSFETCMGNSDWVLSECLKALMQKSIWSEHSRTYGQGREKMLF